MQDSHPHDIAILIVAAGRSARLGSPKQLVKLPTGTTLLRHTVEQCLKASIGTVYVVIGYQAPVIKSELTDLPCQVLICDDWASGMSSSIAYGMRQILDSTTKGVIISTCDQPYLSSHLLQDIATQKEVTEKSIIVCRYDEGQGPPTYFDRRYFMELARLSGDSGAKPVVRAHEEECDYYTFRQGYIDVDTPADLSRLADIDDLGRNCFRRIPK